MDENVLNLSVRKFLKKLGVTAQREIERRVAEAAAQARLGRDARLAIAAHITVPAIGLELAVDGTLELE
ncbi:hypothetical protein HRbin40_01090 [bacterium HR40]|nr:hypothetical protein HRbin40_01090 [bacterium HR40]